MNNKLHSHLRMAAAEASRGGGSINLTFTLDSAVVKTQNWLSHVEVF